MAIKVCLDAGHYGKYNRSPVVKSYYESDMTWKLHKLLAKYLKKYGIKVVKTRSIKSKDLELHTRGTKSKGCDLFLSKHSNAAANEDVDYVAVYCLADDKNVKCDDISKEIAEKLAPVIADVMGVKQGYKVLTRKADYDRNRDGFLNDNYYGVLHGARTVGTPGLILEHSFHTNKEATKWLLDDSNLDKLAKAEAEVIAEYFNVVDKKKKSVYYSKYTGNSTQIDIVLKAIGVPARYRGSITARRPLAKANGITGTYKGTGAQNRKLIRKAKKGKLKKV